MIEDMRRELAGQLLFQDPPPMGSVFCKGCNATMPLTPKQGGGYHEKCLRCTVPRHPGESKWNYWQRVAEHYKTPEPKPMGRGRRKRKKAPKGILNPALS